MIISQIFKKKGEDFFRKEEQEEVLKSLKNHNSVIALGGGAFINKIIRHLPDTHHHISEYSVYEVILFSPVHRAWSAHSLTPTHIIIGALLIITQIVESSKMGVYTVLLL